MTPIIHLDFFWPVKAFGSVEMLKEGDGLDLGAEYLRQWRPGW